MKYWFLLLPSNVLLYLQFFLFPFADSNDKFRESYIGEEPYGQGRQGRM